MKSDTVKTIIGLIVIGIIVVATFLYGNSQRQAQIKNENNTKTQQANKTAAPVPSSSISPANVNTSTHNTAPVASPTANSIQGGSAAGKVGTPSSTVAPSVTPVPVAVVAVMPDTGSSIPAAIGIGFSLLALVYWLASRRLLNATLRNPR